MLIYLLCTAQGIVVFGKNDLEERNLKGKIKKVHTAMWEAGSDSGRYKKGRLIEDRFVTYDQKGMETVYKGNCDIHFTRKESGRELYITMDASNGKKAYDTNNREIFELTYDCKDSLSDSTEYTYDSHGNLSMTKTYKPKGLLSDSTTYKYNNNGKCIEERRFYGEVENISLIYYNEHMDIVRKEYFSGKEKPLRIQYTYNATNNLVEESWYHQDTLSGKRSYVFDKNSRIIEEVKYSSHGSIELRSLYTHGSNGNKTRENRIDYSNPGKVDSAIEYFDEHEKIATRDIYINFKLTEHDKYDKHENEILSVQYFYNINGGISYKQYKVMTYDNHNMITRAEDRTIEGNGSFSTPQSRKCRDERHIETYSYTYDNIGNLIKKVEIAAGVPILITEYTIEYYH